MPGTFHCQWFHSPAVCMCTDAYDRAAKWYEPPLLCLLLTATEHGYLSIRNNKKGEAHSWKFVTLASRIINSMLLCIDLRQLKWVTKITAFSNRNFHCSSPLQCQKATQFPRATLRIGVSKVVKTNNNSNFVLTENGSTSSILNQLSPPMSFISTDRKHSSVTHLFIPVFGRLEYRYSREPRLESWQSGFPLPQQVNGQDNTCNRLRQLPSKTPSSSSFTSHPAVDKCSWSYSIRS